MNKHITHYTIMFFLWAVDLFIDRPVNDCMACGGAHGECGKIARHLNRIFVRRDKKVPGQVVKQVHLGVWVKAKQVKIVSLS